MGVDDTAITTAATLASPALSIAALPLWQRRIVALVQSGVELRRAAYRCTISPDTLNRYMSPGSAFAVAVHNAEAAATIMGVEDARQLAIAHASGLILDAIETSRDPDVAQRDRLGNRRLGLEAAGVVGQGAQQAPGVQVIVALQTGATAERVRARRTQLAGAPPSVDAPA